MIMERIEPDLTTDMLPLLDDLYCLETEEEHKEREEWYKKVFVQFELEYGIFVNGIKNYYVGLRKKTGSIVRKIKENAEKVSTDSIENSIQNS